MEASATACRCQAGPDGPRVDRLSPVWHEAGGRRRATRQLDICHSRLAGAGWRAGPQGTALKSARGANRKQLPKGGTAQIEPARRHARAACFEFKKIKKWLMCAGPALDKRKKVLLRQALRLQRDWATCCSFFMRSQTCSPDVARHHPLNLGYGHVQCIARCSACR